LSIQQRNKERKREGAKVMEEDKQQTEKPSIRLVTNEESPPPTATTSSQQSPDRSSTHLPELILGPVFQEKAFEKHLSIICLDEYECEEETSSSSEVSLF